MKYKIFKPSFGLFVPATALFLILFSCKKKFASCNIHLPTTAEPIPFTILSEESEVREGVRICGTKVVKWGPHYSEIMSLDPLGGVIYPLAVLNYNSFEKGEYIPISGDRKSAVVSISLSNISGIVSEKIENPSLSSVREAIQKILQSKTSGGTAAKISWSQKQVFSENHFRLTVQGNFGSLWADINASYEYNNNEIIGRFLFEFTQEYYSIDADAPQPGIQNFFKTSPDCTQVGGVSPVWVSSVKYGRKVYLMVESRTYDYSHMGEIEASFNSFFASGGVSAGSTLSKLMDEKSIKGVIIGGPAYQGIKAITDIKGLKDYLLAGANFNEKSPGVPLSYTLRFINDNSIAKLALFDQFTIRDCIIAPAHTTSFQPTSISEIKLNHTDGDKEFSGKGPNVKMKIDLYLSTNQREVWARINLRMSEAGGDNTTGSRIYEVKLWTCPAGKKIVKIASRKSQTVEYTDNDILFDEFNFPISDIVKNVKFRGDTDGDDLDLSDIESTGHLHKLVFNKIFVEIQ
jgi:hypothetical protein